jgi:penicillin-insensitive murein endopeptidase
VPGVSAELSIGAPHRGWITGAIRMRERGVGFELFRRTSEGGQPWGVRRLIAAIERAARYAAERAPGSVPLRVGDLSSRRGGSLTARHHSHRSGRDGDLIFFALDTLGRPVPSPAFVRYDAQGVSMDPNYPGLRFDVVRNWLLVESLVTDRAAGVGRIFCADRLTTLLLAHAREHHRDGDVIMRASMVLRQPSDSAAHDDHFHVRVVCTPEERAMGCEDAAPLWWWLEREFGKGDVATTDDEAILALIGEPAR